MRHISDTVTCRLISVVYIHQMQLSDTVACRLISSIHLDVKIVT
uniref:Uncharacterized protein n=1 Tax=Arundo donax TaxID=35708 RepID=A0A0A9CZZ8_ARUDO